MSASADGTPVAKPPHDHTIEPGEVNRRGCRRCEIDAQASPTTMRAANRYREPVRPTLAKDATAILRDRATIVRRAGAHFYQLPLAVQDALYGLAAELEYIADFIGASDAGA